MFKKKNKYVLFENPIYFSEKRKTLPKLFNTKIRVKIIFQNS